MSRRLVGGIVPAGASRLPVERALERPGLGAVAALEEAGRLCAGEHPAVGGAQGRDLRDLELAAARAVVVGEALARQLPRLAEVGAAPDSGARPLTRGRSVDGARVRIVHGVVDRPSFAERAARLPVAAAFVAFEDEAALAGSDKKNGLRHRRTSSFDGFEVLDGSAPEKSSEPSRVLATYDGPRCRNRRPPSR